VKLLKEGVSIRVMAVTGTITMALFAGMGCSSDKVLVDRAFIPAPSDQISDAGLPALAPLDTNITPISNPPPLPEFKAEAITYTIKKGDSLWKIARIYGVSMQELAAFNNMDLKKTLQVGTMVKIPPGGALIPNDKLPPLPKKAVVNSAAPNGNKSEALVSDGTYAVKSGDSLWKIAKKFKTTPDKIAAASKIDPKTPLQVGTKLVIPGASTAGVETESLANMPSEGKQGSIKSDVLPVADSKAPVDDFSDMDNLDTILTEEDVKSVPETATPGNTAAPLPAPSSSQIFDEMNGFPHTVEEGETWASIAKFYGSKLDDLKKANPSTSALGEPKPGSSVIIPSQF
jgi:LysM repeat protein